jgi:hypothetical protein
MCYHVPEIHVSLLHGLPVGLYATVERFLCNHRNVIFSRSYFWRKIQFFPMLMCGRVTCALLIQIISFVGF